MAYNITDFTRHVAASGDYPRGDIKDNPSGTLVNKVMMTDTIQFFSKLMAEVGVTPNGTPDNLTNGYQLYKALLEFTFGNANPGAINVAAEAEWVDLGTATTFTGVGGTITVQTADIKYNRYKIIGRTLFYALHVESATMGAGTSSFYFDLPAAVKALGLEFAYIGAITPGHYQGSNTLKVTTGGPITGADQITVSNTGGFTAGTNDQFFGFTLVAELTV